MFLNYEDFVNKNLTHKITLVEPYLFAFSQIGFGLRMLYHGEFLDHLITQREKNLFQLNKIFEVFIENLHISADDAIVSYTLEGLPLPDIYRNLAENINTIVPHIRKTVQAKGELEVTNILALLHKDLETVVKGTNEEIFFPFFKLGYELATEFHALNGPQYFNENILKYLETNVAFVVENATDIYDHKIIEIDALAIGPELYLEATRLDDSWKVTYYFNTISLGGEFYLALPLMLMHEFISHIFTVDFEFGDYRIASRSFLEGWMVWAIENYVEHRSSFWDYSQTPYSYIQLLSERLDAFRGLRFTTYNSSMPHYSKHIRIGRDIARWFCNHLFNWPTFLLISQDLLKYPSDPSLLGEKIYDFTPRPTTNLHEEFIQRLNKINGLLNSKQAPLAHQRLHEIFLEPPKSLRDCWNGIFSNRLDFVE